MSDYISREAAMEIVKRTSGWGEGHDRHLGWHHLDCSIPFLGCVGGADHPLEAYLSAEGVTESDRLLQLPMLVQRGEREQASLQVRVRGLPQQGYRITYYHEHPNAGERRN